jgi:sec-independent protein translocase protein TatB
VGILDNVGGWELLVIILIGIFIFGPDRLPKAIADGVKFLRQIREMARNATGDLNRELGTTLELEDLNPKTFLRKHLLSEEEEEALREPLQKIYSELRNDLKSVEKSATEIATSINSGASSVAANISAAATATAAAASDAVNLHKADSSSPSGPVSAPAATGAEKPAANQWAMDQDIT